MYNPQIGGEQYLNDQLTIFKDYGWHFAFWDWRRGPGADWNIEKFGDTDNLHWKTVLSKFHAPPVPSMESPASYQITSRSPSFSWDSMTAFTLFDIEFTKVDGTSEDDFIISDINKSSYTFSENVFQDNRTYSWRIRSKNPGGLPENCSDWSEPRVFNVNESSSHITKHPVTEEYKLNQNYPNPFNPTTTIFYTIKENSRVKLAVYDMLGREVAGLVDASQFAGEHSAMFNASGLASGVYIYKLEAAPLNGKNGFTQIKKMILVK